MKNWLVFLVKYYSRFVICNLFLILVMIFCEVFLR